MGFYLLLVFGLTFVGTRSLPKLDSWVIHWSREQPDQNCYCPGESDCLIKTKLCDGSSGLSHKVISAQCSECQCKEI